MMMKIRLFHSLIPSILLRASLFAVFLAACAPAAAPETAAPTALPPTATFPPPVPTLEQGQPMPRMTEAPTEAVAPTPLPVATSRGPELHATDPTTVNLASGQLQFVEFFRFT